MSSALAVQRKDDGMLVVPCDTSVMVSIRFLDAAESARAGYACRSGREPAFDQVQPRTAGRDEVDVKPRVALQPLADRRVLVRA